MMSTNQNVTRHPDLDSTVTDLWSLKGEDRNCLEIEIADSDGIRTVVKVKKTKVTNALGCFETIGRKGDFLIIVPDLRLPNMKHQVPIIEERYP